MSVYTNNDWDPLEHVIVGTATNAHWPTQCPVFRATEQTTKWKDTPVPSGKVSKIIEREANVDLDSIAELLILCGVIVDRPKDLDFASFDGMYNYCPRDRLLILGDKVIDAPMMFPTRKKEIEALTTLIDADIIGCDDPEAMFDAANICRLNKDLLYLVSESGNLAGAEWLKRKFPEYNVHVLSDYGGVHIDSTIVPVREGLVILNKDRIKEVPEPLKKWDKIWVGKEDLRERKFVDYPYASNYIALNILTLRDNLVLCDPNQTYLREKLGDHNIMSLGVDLRHARTLGGGHHCVTLDLRRGS